MGAKGLARDRSHAIRPWPDQKAYEGKDGAANETLATYFQQNCGPEVHRNFSGRHRAATAISYLRVFSRACHLDDYVTPVSLWLVLLCTWYWDAKSFSVSRALAAHVTAPLSSGRAARSRRKSQLSYFLFGSVARLPGNSEWTQNSLEWNERPTSSLAPFQPFQPGRNKSRHAW